MFVADERTLATYLPRCLPLRSCTYIPQAELFIPATLRACVRAARCGFRVFALFMCLFSALDSSLMHDAPRECCGRTASTLPIYRALYFDLDKYARLFSLRKYVATFLTINKVSLSSQQLTSKRCFSIFQSGSSKNGFFRLVSAGGASDAHAAARNAR